MKKHECDICKKPTEKIVAKLYLTPLTKRENKNGAFNRYKFHLDVGVCCEDRLRTGFRWSERMTAQQYNDSRRRTA